MAASVKSLGQQVTDYLHSHFDSMQLEPESQKMVEAYVSDLPSYQWHAPELPVKNTDRKWEIVSCYQKAVRRGDTAQALRMVSAMSSMPKELAYFSRRLTVTACEDVGFGSPQLTTFVTAALAALTPAKLKDPADMRQVFGYLTECMTQAIRSRVSCSLSVIQNKMKELEKLDDFTSLFTEWDSKLMSHVLSSAITSQEPWFLANDWRGEGMLQYVSPNMVTTVTNCVALEEVCLRGDQLPEAKNLYGLPTYTYDMHTRVGKHAIAMLTKHVQKTGELLAALPVDTKYAWSDMTKLIGWCVFYAEGGRIRNEIWIPKLLELEHRTVWASFHLSMEEGEFLLASVADWIARGDLDKYRKIALSHAGYQN